MTFDNTSKRYFLYMIILAFYGILMDVLGHLSVLPYIFACSMVVIFEVQYCFGKLKDAIQEKNDE